MKAFVIEVKNQSIINIKNQVKMSASKNQVTSKNQSIINNKNQSTMNATEIKERVQELATAIGVVEFTERQFVFNQLFMSYIKMNDITTQGETYDEIYPNIVKHYKDFEDISKGYIGSKFESFLDEVNDYLIYCVRGKELTQTEQYEKTRQDAYDLLEGCLRAKIVGYEDITEYNQNVKQPTL